MKRKIVFIILTLMWCAVIFMFSAENAFDSSKTSQGTLTLILGTLFNLKKAQTIITKYAMLETILRKAAHFSVFGVLGVLSVCTLKQFNARHAFAYMVVFCALYALSDEVHQYFVPGRACRFLDVCIDTSGACTFAIIANAIQRSINIMKNQ